MKDIWIPLSGAIAQQKNVETIANNIANAGTPGFKKDQQIFQEYLTTLNKETVGPDLPHKEWKPEDFYRTQGTEHGFVKAEGSYTVFEQGPLSPTGNPLDLAIHGSGLFEVLAENGVRYTRKGNFSISQNGFLVTDQGYHVLKAKAPAPPATGSSPGQPPLTPIEERFIPVGTDKISVNFQGEIFSGAQNLGKISVVEFQDLNSLKKEGNSLFINSSDQNIKTEEGKSKVYQGFMEDSNVNPISEMSALIKANRHFESIQKAVRAYDNMAGKSVNEIAKF